MTNRPQLKIVHKDGDLAADDVTSEGRWLTIDMPAMLNSVQPVFQQAFNAATSEDERAIVTKGWEELQTTIQQHNTWNQEALRLFEQMRQQRNASVADLKDMLDELQKASVEQDTHTYEGEVDPASLTQGYRPEVTNLIEAVERRLYDELQYERYDLQEKVHDSLYESITGNIKAFVAYRMDSTHLAYGDALVKLLVTTDELTVDEKRHAAAALRGLMAHLEDK